MSRSPLPPPGPFPRARARLAEAAAKLDNAVAGYAREAELAPLRPRKLSLAAAARSEAEELRAAIALLAAPPKGSPP